MSSTLKILSIFIVCLGLAVALTYSMWGLAQVECELCVDFKGQSVCQTAFGPDRKTAIEEASRAACAQMSAGVTEVLACQRTPARDISCESD